MAKNLFNKKTLKNDVILAGVLLLIAFGLIVTLSLTKQKGDIVCVKIDGKEAYRYSINENVDTVIYTGDDNQGKNRIVIKNGRVYVADANCPDKICAEHRAIENANESIICLPHKIVVEIISNNGENQMDAAV